MYLYSPKDSVYRHPTQHGNKGDWQVYGRLYNRMKTLMRSRKENSTLRSLRSITTLYKTNFQLRDSKNFSIIRPVALFRSLSFHISFFSLLVSHINYHIEVVTGCLLNNLTKVKLKSFCLSIYPSQRSRNLLCSNCFKILV